MHWALLNLPNTCNLTLLRFHSSRMETGQSWTFHWKEKSRWWLGWLRLKNCHETTTLHNLLGRKSKARIRILNLRIQGSSDCGDVFPFSPFSFFETKGNSHITLQKAEMKWGGREKRHVLGDLYDDSDLALRWYDNLLHLIVSRNPISQCSYEQA